jgi:hypothetical protein
MTGQRMDVELHGSFLGSGALSKSHRLRLV